MTKGKKIFIVKTLSGEYVGIYKSQAFARSAVSRAETNGFECVVIEATVDEVHTKG